MTGRVVYRDVALKDGRTLRVGLLTRDGRPEELIFAMGRGEGESWREDPAEGLIAPGTALPGVLAALQGLQEE